MSGLVSRTVLNLQFMKEHDFHGAKYYKELEDVDVSNLYIDRVSVYFNQVQHEVAQQIRAHSQSQLHGKA